MATISERSESGEARSKEEERQGLWHRAALHLQIGIAHHGRRDTAVELEVEDTDKSELRAHGHRIRQACGGAGEVSSVDRRGIDPALVGRTADSGHCK